MQTLVKDQLRFKDEKSDFERQQTKLTESIREISEEKQQLGIKYGEHQKL